MPSRSPPSASTVAAGGATTEPARRPRGSQGAPPRCRRLRVRGTVANSWMAVQAAWAKLTRLRPASFEV
jgi:hypothetical protein